MNIHFNHNQSRKLALAMHEVLMSRHEILIHANRDHSVVIANDQDRNLLLRRAYRSQEEAYSHLGRVEELRSRFLDSSSKKNEELGEYYFYDLNDNACSIADKKQLEKVLNTCIETTHSNIRKQIVKVLFEKGSEALKEIRRNIEIEEEIVLIDNKTKTDLLSIDGRKEYAFCFSDHMEKDMVYIDHLFHTLAPSIVCEEEVVNEHSMMFRRDYKELRVHLH
ncbi:MAG: hypothetical protein FJZ56_04440 [Chlamydiae bacterium]|nr:hypothetical protein [Chlamydiota bacterium]